MPDPRTQIDSILRGGRITRVGELASKGYNLAVTCLECQDRSVIHGARLYQWFVCKFRYDSFDVCRRKLKCRACGSARIITRATTDEAQDRLPEVDPAWEGWGSNSVMRGF
jgi:ribosomal protein S27E